MAKLKTRRFVPTPEQQNNGVEPMSQAEIVETLKAYKKQNPAKYEHKKAALFKRYGLAPDAPVEDIPDASDEELEKVAKAVKTRKNAK